jgi:penicillin-binding protein 1A
MIKKVISVVIGVYGFGIGFSVSMIKVIDKALPSIERLEDYTTHGISKIYDRKGRLIHEFYEQRRIPIPLEKIPSQFIETTIAIEDKNFYNHYGIDLSGILRALFYNILNLRVIQGGSTITQQLARNLFLTPSRSLLRKIKEMLLAFKIERSYSKEEILELYFNQIYYGNGAYGIETAAQRYFGKSAKDLDIAECATLVGIPKCPEKYNPYTNIENSIKRRNFVLNVMEKNGIITTEEKEKIQSQELHLSSAPVFQGDYFTEEVRKWVIARYGPDLLYRGELSIYTSLDIEMQKIAKEVIKQGIIDIEKKYKLSQKDTLQSALLAMDPRTGGILAEIGGRDFAKSMFNRAVQAKRQAGSAFKPFTWIAALADTFTLASIVEDEPISIPLVTGDIYSPHNYDHKYLGKITLREGIAHSRNLVAVRLINVVGPQKVVRYARRMGITSPLDPVIALSLGSSSVTLLDMVSAYSTIAHNGMAVLPPYMIERIIDKDGRVLYSHIGFKEQVISPELAYLINSLLQSVINEGTGINVRTRGFYYPAAGKTGTTDKCADAWFIGYIPDLVCGVWVGFDEVKRIGRNATGAKVALPIWTEFMLKVVETLNIPYKEFQRPEGIVTREICEKCGNLASTGSIDVRKEVFIKGKEPTKYCFGRHFFE